MPAFDYSNIKGKQRRAYNVGGGTQKFYFVSRTDTVVIPRPKDLLDLTITSPKEVVEITTDITFAVGKGWREGYCTRDRATIKGTQSAERDASGYKFDGEVFVPGVDGDDLGNIQVLMNDDVLILMPTVDSKYLLLGSSMFSAEIKGEFDLAKNESGVRGTLLKLSSFEVGPQLYSGVITMHP